MELRLRLFPFTRASADVRVSALTGRPCLRRLRSCYPVRNQADLEKLKSSAGAVGVDLCVNVALWPLYAYRVTRIVAVN